MAQEPPARPKKGAKAGQISSLMVAIFHTLMILITKGGGKEGEERKEGGGKDKGSSRLPSSLPCSKIRDLGIWGSRDLGIGGKG